MTIAIAFAGKIGSGKTSLSKTLAERLGVPRASFGDYVRSATQQRGVPTTRENLQKIGTELLESDRASFCRSVIMTSGWVPGQSLVIDGLRHEETIPLIQKILAPVPLKIVFLDIDDELRLKRLAQRGDGNEAALTQVDAHSSEKQVSTTLMRRADLVVDTSNSIARTVKEIEGWMAREGRDL